LIILLIVLYIGIYENIGKKKPENQVSS